MTQRKKKAEKTPEETAVVAVEEATTSPPLVVEPEEQLAAPLTRSPVAEERHRLDVLIAAEKDRIRQATGMSGRAMGGLVAKVNASKQRLEELEKERSDLARTSARICVVKDAPESEEFFSLLEQEGPVVVLDANQPYIDLAEKVVVTCNKRLDYGLDQHVRLLETLGEWGRENNVASMPRPSFQARSCRDAEGLTAHIRRLVEDAFEGEYASMGLARLLSEDIERYEFADFIPVVVLNDPKAIVSRNLARNRKVLEVSVVPGEPLDGVVTRILDTLSSPP